MPNENEPQNDEFSVPSFATVEDAKQALASKDKFDRSANLYPRDGTKDLSALEDRIARLVGVNAGEVILYGSGMTAVMEAVELAAPTKDDLAAFSMQLYSQTANYRDSLRERGVKILNFEAGRSESTERIAQKEPKVILAETVANTPEMSVLDTKKFVDLDAHDKSDPLIILDNTLPTPTAGPLTNILVETRRKILVVESGTKSYRMNKGLLGIIYSKNLELLESLRRRRRMTGTLPDISSVKAAAATLPSKDFFDQRNEKILTNTKHFAEVVAEMVNGKTQFRVSHPNLPGHQNYQNAQTQYPNGATQVLFIVDQRLEPDQFGLLTALWQNDIRRNCELGQSFGFNKTRLWADQNYPAVRIACGTEDAVAIEHLAQECGRIILNIPQ